MAMCPNYFGQADLWSDVPPTHIREIVKIVFLDVSASCKILINFDTPNIRLIVKSGFLDVSTNFKILKHFGNPYKGNCEK